MQRRYGEDEEVKLLSVDKKSCSFSATGGTSTVTVYLGDEILKDPDVVLSKTGNCPNSYSYNSSTGKITIKCNVNDSETTSYSGSIKVTYHNMTVTISCTQGADYVTSTSVKYRDISEVGTVGSLSNKGLTASLYTGSSDSNTKCRGVNGSLSGTIYAIYTTKHITNKYASGKETYVDETGTWRYELKDPYISVIYLASASDTVVPTVITGNTATYSTPGSNMVTSTFSVGSSASGYSTYSITWRATATLTFTSLRSYSCNMSISASTGSGVTNNIGSHSFTCTVNAS